MRGGITGLCLALALSQSHAAENWAFSDRVSVSAPSEIDVYLHLDGSGRKHIAVSEDSIAVVWEDNRSRDPQIYVTQKSMQQESFLPARIASNGSEAYEPAIAALSENRFVIAFEQDGAIFARVFDAGGLNAPTLISQATASHAGIATIADQVFASWRELDKGLWYIKFAALRIDADNRLIIESRQTIETGGLESPVLFPAIAVNGAGLCIAWEDRRAGHTRLLFSHAQNAGETFSEPQSLNEFFSNRNAYDRGNGVTRVSLASFADDEILAAWMDKRRGGKGYGIFAALGAEGGGEFGPNEKVHGQEGDTQPHYNPATAGSRDGNYAVAWDDFRRGDSDIWISTYNDDLEWSEDYSPPVARGAGEQSHPSIALDEQQNLHLLWIERDDLNGPSKLWYSRGQPRQAQ